MSVDACCFASTSKLPLLLTVEEAAELLRIGRTLAYSLARRYEASSGVAGLPVIRLGSCLRVPRWALLELAHSGRVVALAELAAHSAPGLDEPDNAPALGPRDELDQLAKVAQTVESEPKRPKRPLAVVRAARVDQQLALLPPE